MSNKIVWAVWFIMYVMVAKKSHSETRQEILVIDTGIPNDETYHRSLCDGPHYDITGYGTTDNLGHGTNIIGIISKNLDTSKYCIRSLKWFHTIQTSKNSRELVRRYAAIMDTLSPAFINMSLAGYTYEIQEFRAIQRQTLKGTTVIVSAGNDAKNLDISCDIFPGCYRINSPKFRVVTSRESYPPFFLHSFSNFGKVVTDYEDGVNVCGYGLCMSGTSQATAILTRKLINKEIR